LRGGGRVKKAVFERYICEAYKVAKLVKAITVIVKNLVEIFFN